MAKDTGPSDVTVNLVGAPMVQAAKAVLGDLLKFNYSVDPRVQGTVTLQISKPVSRMRLLSMFEGVLRENGAALVNDGGNFKVVPLQEAGRSTSPLSTGENATPASGFGPQIIPLRYVSAENMNEVLAPMLPQGMLVHVDPRRNALILSGSPSELDAIRETISIFDVDWMRGMSFALIPVKSSSPGAIVQDLEQVFETRSGPLKGVLKFVPNNRLRSVLVISSRAKYLKEAERWIKKMDVLAQSSEDNLHVYHIQNRNATELAKLLEQIFESGQGGGAQGDVAPKYQSAAANVAPQAAQGQQGAAAPVGGPETPKVGIDVIPADQNDAALADPVRPNHIRVVADDANNALLVYCSDQQFDRIQNVLAQIDSVPNQVLLEAVIAEVSLDDDLKFGVRWFLGNNSSGGGGFSDAANGAASPVFPGFSYFLKANDIAFSLNALSSVTNVKVLSAPSMVVLDNKKATLQVGDQVPVVTQTAQGVGAAGAPIVSNVELKDTGVILNITPRVNDSGVVTLDIEQQVSTVVKTTTSGIDSPTIRQRKMTTSVVVNNGEALALGGLIQDRENVTKSKVPVLGDVPLLGAAFRNKQDTLSRTELIMFVRPRVIRSMTEARQVTAEFRRQLSIDAPRVPATYPSAGGELTRIFN
ncbi:MAG: type II secretion system secretin GspD [Alphaproteobacteria bacterium]|nr:type II secretion system secretin GspD [Alphaproteobacteria bacterium]